MQYWCKDGHFELKSPDQSYSVTVELKVGEITISHGEDHATLSGFKPKYTTTTKDIEFPCGLRAQSVSKRVAGDEGAGYNADGYWVPA